MVTPLGRGLLGKGDSEMWKEQKEPTLMNLIIFHHRFGCFTLQLCFGELTFPEWIQSWWDCQSGVLPSSGWWFGTGLQEGWACVFSTWTLNGLIRAKELTHNSCNTPKLGLFLPVTSELPSLPLLEIFRLSFNSVCYSIFLVILFLFQLTRFSFYCSQPRNQRDTKPPFHGPLSHPVFWVLQSHEMIRDNDKCMPGVWWQVVTKYLLFYNYIK